MLVSVNLTHLETPGKSPSEELSRAGWLWICHCGDCLDCKGGVKTHSQWGWYHFMDWALTRIRVKKAKWKQANRLRGYIHFSLPLTIGLMWPVAWVLALASTKGWDVTSNCKLNNPSFCTLLFRVFSISNRSESKTEIKQAFKKLGDPYHFIWMFGNYCGHSVRMPILVGSCSYNS